MEAQIHLKKLFLPNKNWHMNLHEYQGKSILKSYGVAIQEGVVVDRVEDAVAAAKKLSDTPRYKVASRGQDPVTTRELQVGLGG